MIPVGLSLAAVFAFGWFLVGPANRGYSAKGWTLLVSFLAFMYLFVMVMSLIVGGWIEGRPIAPVATEIIVIAYAAGAALATGVGAGLRSRADTRKSGSTQLREG